MRPVHVDIILKALSQKNDSCSVAKEKRSQTEPTRHWGQDVLQVYTAIIYPSPHLLYLVGTPLEYVPGEWGGSDERRVVRGAVHTGERTAERGVPFAEVGGHSRGGPDAGVVSFTVPYGELCATVDWDD